VPLASPAAAGACLVLLVGCQSYAPRPLDAARHRAAWHARTLEDASLAQLIERLERDAPGAAFDPRDGLTLQEGQLVALAFNPHLRVARARAGRAAAGAAHAGRFADPELSLSVLRLTGGAPDPWVVTPGLAFSIPLSGRRGAQRELGAAQQRAALRRVEEAEWAVWHDVERAWIAWSAAALRVEELELFVGALEGLARTATQLAESGELAPSEASLFAVELAQRANQLLRLRGELEAAEQELRAQLGLAPEAPVAFVRALARRAPAAASLAELAARNPSLARLREEYEVAERTLRHELAQQVPDLTLGPLFESDEGRSKIGFAGALPLPFLNANRRAIAEARAGREVARAAFEAGYEALVGRRAAAAARAAALAEQRADLEGVLVPLVDRQVADALRLVQLGEGTSLVLIESLARAQQTKLALIESRAAEALARAELEYLTGPPAAGSGAPGAADAE
jgi:outer membrane protein TolC